MISLRLTAGACMVGLALSAFAAVIQFKIGHIFLGCANAAVAVANGAMAFVNMRLAAHIGAGNP